MQRTRLVSAYPSGLRYCCRVSGWHPFLREELGCGRHSHCTTRNFHDGRRAAQPRKNPRYSAPQPHRAADGMESGDDSFRRVPGIGRLRLRLPLQSFQGELWTSFSLWDYRACNGADRRFVRTRRRVPRRRLISSGQLSNVRKEASCGMNEVVELSEQQLRPRASVNWSTDGPTSMCERDNSIQATMVDSCYRFNCTTVEVILV